ncbi:MAG: hypothetical protein QMD22_10230, partial [archaeon]|nr:hypothetical protein [archaeon]
SAALPLSHSGIGAISVGLRPITGSARAPASPGGAYPASPVRAYCECYVNFATILYKVLWILV